MKPEIQELLRMVKERYNKPLVTAGEYEDFSIYIKEQTGEYISVSTLKRLWGYVNETHIPRSYTLNILARLAGHEDFYKFSKWLKANPAFNSSFFSTKQVSSSKLSIGQKIEIGWAPDRLIRLSYMGNSLFVVEDVKSSKLKVGDTFENEHFFLGHPLFLPYILRDNTRTKPFIAGRNGGLTILNVI